MRAAISVFFFVTAFFCMMVVTIIVDIIGVGMIIYHTFNHSFEKRSIKKHGTKWQSYCL